MSIKRVVLPPYDQYELSTFVVHNNTVYIGHFGAGGDTVEEQMENVLLALNKALGEIQLSLANVAKLTVILRDIEDFHKIHAVWAKYFPEGFYPVRTTITSEFIDPNCLVQIEGVACID